MLFACFMKEPADRPTAAEFLASEWQQSHATGHDLSCLPALPEESDELAHSLDIAPHSANEI